MELISTDWLGNLLETRGMSRRSLARRIGIAPATVIKLAAGTNATTTPAIASAIEQELGVAPGMLFRVRQPITVCRLCGNQYSLEKVAATDAEAVA